MTLDRRLKLCLLPRAARPASAALLLLLLGLSLSCGVAAATRSLFGGRLPFDVTVAPDANDSNAVAVDFVIVYDAHLADDVLKLSAADWFRQKDQLLKDHPKQLDVQHREWVPSQPVAALALPFEAGARKVIVFADYGTEGAHRAAFDPPQKSRLVLEKLNFSLEKTP